MNNHYRQLKREDSQKSILVVCLQHLQIKSIKDGVIKAIEEIDWTFGLEERVETISTTESVEHRSNTRVQVGEPNVKSLEGINYKSNSSANIISNPRIP